MSYSRTIQWIGSDAEFKLLLAKFLEKNWWFSVRRQTTKQGGRRTLTFARNITDTELGRWAVWYEPIVEIEHQAQPHARS